MLEVLIKKIFGDPSEKRLKQYQKELASIRELESDISEKYPSVESIQSRMKELRSSFSGLDYRKAEDYEEIRKRLNEAKHEVFALHRRACSLIAGQTFTLEDGRETVWNMVPYDVQLLGALALHDGNISEMRTGEGKTLVATIAASLNAIAGYPVHIVTVNDYLAQRDAAEMGIIYRTL